MAVLASGRRLCFSAILTESVDAARCPQFGQSLTAMLLQPLLQKEQDFFPHFCCLLVPHRVTGQPPGIGCSPASSAGILAKRDTQRPGGTLESAQGSQYNSTVNCASYTQPPERRQSARPESRRLPHIGVPSRA